MGAARSTSFAAGVLSLGAFSCGSYAVLELFPDRASVSVGDGSPVPDDATTRAGGEEADDAGRSADSAAEGRAAAGGQPTGDAGPRGALDSAADAEDAGPICYPSWSCGPCTSDVNCNSGPLPGHCDVPSKRCVECLSNSDCLGQVCVPGQLACK